MTNKKDHSKSESYLQWQTVIESCLRNDRRAQEKLYRHFFPVMERMVMRYTRDEDQLIDIINDGFLRVFKKLDLFDGKGSFEGWIRRIVYHSLSNYFRKNKNDLKFLIYEEITNEPANQSEHSLYYNDLLSLLETLPEQHMQVFHMFAIEGLSHKEISEQLNLNSNTCRWYLSEARKLLQEAYFKKFTSNYNEAG